MCQVSFTASLKMTCPLKANPPDTISKCCSKLTDSHQAGVLRKKWSKQAEKKAAARPEGEAQRSQSAEGEWVRSCGKHRRGVESPTARAPGTVDSSVINTPCIPGPRTEDCQHGRPRANGPGNVRVTPVSKSWVCGKRPKQASQRGGRRGWVRMGKDE